MGAPILELLLAFASAGSPADALVAGQPVLELRAHERLSVRLQNARYHPGPAPPPVPVQPRITKTWLTTTYIF